MKEKPLLAYRFQDVAAFHINAKGNRPTCRGCGLPDVLLFERDECPHNMGLYPARNPKEPSP